MRRTSIDDVDPSMPGSDLDRRPLADAVGAENLAANYYALDPGEAFSGGMHTHMDQEELFYVVEGTATFETKPEATAESETVEVGAGEVVRFAPGEFQQGRNESHDRLVALALGSPKETEDVRVPQACPECHDSDTLRVVMGEDGRSYECPACEATVDVSS